MAREECRGGEDGADVLEGRKRFSAKQGAGCGRIREWETERKGGEEGGEMRPQIRIGICSDDVSVAKGWNPR